MSNETLIVIVGMAVIIYATRAGGCWLVSRFIPSPRVGMALDHLAGVTLVALTAPAVFTLVPAGLVAAAAVGIVARRTGSLMLAMVVGMGVFTAMR